MNRQIRYLLENKSWDVGFIFHKISEKEKESKHWNQLENLPGGRGTQVSTEDGDVWLGKDFPETLLH